MNDDIKKTLKRLVRGKEALRKESAKLSFEQKIEIVKRLQKIAETIRRDRNEH
jgi:hypothetical protein